MKSTVSDRKSRANRTNAQKSTGPRSPEGKSRSSRNALKHGLLSSQVVITAGDGAERPEDFRTLHRHLHDHFDPRDVIERMLVDRIAGSSSTPSSCHRTNHIGARSQQGWRTSTRHGPSHVVPPPS